MEFIYGDKSNVVSVLKTKYKRTRISSGELQPLAATEGPDGRPDGRLYGWPDSRPDGRPNGRSDRRTEKG